MPLEISDETLRDGEQQARVIFSPEEKMTLANRSAAMGVQYVNFIPIASDEEAMVVRTLARAGMPVTTATMLGEQYVDHSINLGVRDITLFSSVSDILLKAKERTRDQNLEESAQVARYARGKGATLDFAVEDATRADIGYLVEFAQELRPYIRYLVICDTVGAMQPQGFSLLISELGRRAGTRMGVHCHNDLGLAVENTVRGVLSGAELISGTFTGIGERAGNAALEDVLRRLRSDHRLEVPGFDYDQIPEMCHLVRTYAGIGPAEPMSREAFFTETGIHVSALMNDPQAYSIFPGKEPEIWFGKYSGTSNFRWVFERILNDPQTEGRYAKMRDEVKRLSAAQKRSFSADAIIDMYKSGRI